MKISELNMNEKTAGEQLKCRHNRSYKTIRDYTKQLKKRKMPAELIERIRYETKLRIKKEEIAKLIDYIKEDKFFGKPVKIPKDLTNIQFYGETDKSSKCSNFYYETRMVIELLKNVCSKIKDNSVYSRRKYLELLIEIVLQKLDQDTKKGLYKNY